MEFNHLIAPYVDLCRVGLGHKFDLFDWVVCPLDRISSADRAVAFVERPWLVVKMNRDSFAVAGH